MVSGFRRVRREVKIVKHDPKATANALAVVGGGLYAICAAWVVIARESFMGVMNTWAHGIDLAVLPTKPLDLGTIFLGFVTFVLAAWATGYAFAYFYNSFAKKT